MNKNVKIAKELVKLAKSLVASAQVDSIYLVSRINNGKEVREWERGKTPISEAPYQIKQISKSDLSKYINIDSNLTNISLSLPSYWLNIDEYLQLQSDKYDFSPYRMFWTTTKQVAEAVIDQACFYEAEYYKNKENK